MSTARTVAAHSSVWPACTVVLAVLAVLGLAPLSPALVFLAATGMAWAVAAVGLDAFSGYLGQVSFGHAAFVAGGAYGSTVLTNHFGWPLQVSAVAAVGGTAALSAAIGMVLLRLRDFGLVLGTFFLTFVSTALLSGTLLADFTHAASGLQTSRLLLAGIDLSSGRAYYFTCWVVLAVVTLLSAWLAQSGPGRVLRLVKRSDAMALSLGVSPRRVRLLAFVWSATLASLGGVLVALGAGYISPEGFGVQASIMLFAMVAVGGLGSIAGPVVGAVLLLTVPAQLQFAETGQQLLFASLLLLVFVGARGGLYSLVAPLLERSTRRLARRRPVPALTPDALPQDPAATSSLGLVTHGVTLDYGGVRALDDVRLQVRPGTIHALIGPNGAGKTSLLNCLTGLERPTAGKVEVRSDGGSPVAGARIHRTFQNHAVVADLTAVENVNLGLHGAGSSPGRRGQRTAHAEACSSWEFRSTATGPRAPS